MEQATRSLWAGESAHGKNPSFAGEKESFVLSTEQRGREALLLQPGSRLQRKEQLNISTELVELGKAAEEHCPLELSGSWVIAITKASAASSHPDVVASIKGSSHLSFGHSRGNVPFLLQDCS